MMTSILAGRACHIDHEYGAWAVFLKLSN